MKKKIKIIIIDVLMFISIITMMGYHITNNLIHEILGTIIFVLFVAHNILNIKWYSTIFKGKHDLKRNIHIAVNLLLLIVMILTIISGVAMSRNLYTFINLNGVATARKIHLVANAWTLILASIHLGLHLTPLTMKVKNKLKNSSLEYGVYVIIVIFIILGIYLFISQGIWKDLFGIIEFKEFDYNENPVIFYLKYYAIAISIAIITNVISRIKKNRIYHLVRKILIFITNFCK